MTENTQTRGIQISTNSVSVAVTSQFEEDKMQDLRVMAEELVNKYAR